MKLQINTIKQIEVGDWDDFVSTHYGKIYTFQQQDGCKERGVHNFDVPCKFYGKEYKDEMPESIPYEVNGDEMGVKFSTWLATYPEETAKHFDSDWENGVFWERNFYPNFEAIVNDLYKKGLIEEGEYQIRIDW